MYKNIQLITSADRAQIFLNRPDKLNALNEEMMRELIDALKTIQQNRHVRVLIFSGRGRAFSAGVDLKETQSADFSTDQGIIQLGYEVSALLTSMPVVTIARIHGYCFTGALELALMFDLMYCTMDTQFGDTHAKWAIMPRWGMTQRLARRVGLHKAKELTFRALRINGAEAMSIGLVNQAFQSDKFEEEMNQIVNDISANDQEAIARIKHLYDEGFQVSLKQGLEIEMQADTNLSSTSFILQQFEKRK